MAQNGAGQSNYFPRELTIALNNTTESFQLLLPSLSRHHLQALLQMNPRNDSILPHHNHRQRTRSILHLPQYQNPQAITYQHHIQLLRSFSEHHRIMVAPLLRCIAHRPCQHHQRKHHSNFQTLEKKSP